MQEQFDMGDNCFLDLPISILYKSIAGRYRPVRVADGPITARCRFIKNASWDRSVRPGSVWLTRVK